MSSYQTKAFVIGVHSFGDSDKLVTLFTEQQGRVRATAFGARRPKSPLAAALQMFHEVDLTLSEGRRLDVVRTAAILHHPKKLSEDVVTMAYGAFIAELLAEFFPEKQQDEQVYALLGKVFAAFGTRNPRIVALIAAYQLMEFTGLQLSYERCVHTGKRIVGDAFFDVAAGGALSEAETGAEPYPAELREFLVRLLAFDWQSKEKFSLARADLQRAEHILLTHLERLLGHPLRSLTFLRSL